MDPLLPAIEAPTDPCSFSELPEDSLLATWGALRTHSLHWRPGADLADLLRRRPLTGAGDHDTAALVTVPSRAVEAAGVPARHGYAPLLATAARLPGRGLGGGSSVEVRPLTAADLDVAVELNLETVRFDGRFGVVDARASSADRLREHIAELLGRPEPCGWLAVSGGEVVGSPTTTCRGTRTGSPGGRPCDRWRTSG
ncbi:hypothetical protein [Saccharothrix sp. HUAS TT1]|uniref:hypothetical protein n=1 Tax=unclassified Saccharothrix TaxID=2593673 RepID=UPI00345C3581